MYVLLVCDLICMHVYKYVCPFLFPFGLTRVAWLILVKANKLPSHGLSYRAIWVSALYLYLNALLTLVTQLKHVHLYRRCCLPIWAHPEIWLRPQLMRATCCTGFQSRRHGISSIRCCAGLVVPSVIS